MHPTHILRLAIAACACCATVHCTASRTNHVHDHSLLRKSPTSSFNILDGALRALEGEEHEGEEHEGEEHEGEHHDDDEKKPKPWGRVLGGTLLVNLATILGVVFLTPVCRKKQDPDSAGPTKTKSILDVIVPSFAAGALIATALFLTIPEAIALIQGQLMEEGEEDHGDEHGDEHEDHRFMEEDEHDEHGFELMPSAIWRFAASFLGGFMIPLVFAAIFPRNHDEDTANNRVVVSGKDIEDDDGEEATSIEDVKTPINMSLVLSILFGDGLCNFSDGVFIGIAFYQCDLSIAMAVVGITLYHEVPQELADYFLLTRYAGLTPFQALGINFITGLTVVFGGLLVLLVDLSSLSVGVLLAIASGVYTYIAACECLPRVNATISTSNEKLFMMFMFICGAVPVGLTLIGHTHCDAH